MRLKLQSVAVFCSPLLPTFIIASMTYEQHVLDVEDALRTLNGVNLKVNPSKCLLGYRRLRTLGFVISEAGREIDPAKTEAVMEWPVPRDHKSLQRFVGFCNYIRVICHAKVDASFKRDDSVGVRTRSVGRSITVIRRNRSFRVAEIFQDLSIDVGH